MEVLGYFLAILIGLSLGLMGSGGSILMVPLLVYFFGIAPALATSYSLLIVGTVSAIGAVLRWKAGEVALKFVGLFGATTVITVFLTRKYLFPLLPEVFFEVGQLTFTKSFVLMILLAILIFISSVFVLREQRGDTSEKVYHNGFYKLVFGGIGIGLITGFLGAGGGFLIIPFLLVRFQTPIKVATGTSLAIIALNTLMGALGDCGQVTLNWSLLIIILVITLVGMGLGMLWSLKINSQNLKRGFGWFLRILSLLIIALECYELLQSSRIG